jgi:hypothetical protein
MNPALTLLVAFILAVAAEGGVEVVFGQPLNYVKKLEPYKVMILTYIGIGMGIFLSVYYKVDMVAALASLGGEGSVEPSIVGFILSGLVVGRGSNAVHDFISKIIGGYKAKILVKAV